jgi:hypothetical protein
MCVSVCTFDFEAGFAWALPSNFFLLWNACQN